MDDQQDIQSEISITSVSNCDNSNQLLLYNTNKSNQLLLEEMIEGGAPLSLVEAQKFKEFIYSINNLYHISSRKQLSTNILDEVHMKVQTSINQFICKSTWITIATDSWTNICQDHLVNFMAI
ncbi:4960_t:CDS:1, partial [Dentiscutata erythropus]